VIGTGALSWAILAVAGVAAGVVAGLVFFGGLWWTSQRLVTSRRPGLLVVGSLLVRMIVVAGTLVLLARIDVVLLVGAVIGLVAARTALTRAAMQGRLPAPDAASDDSDVRG
jgi:F1F0 ATPase subunit 2